MENPTAEVKILESFQEYKKGGLRVWKYTHDKAGDIYNIGLIIGKDEEQYIALRKQEFLILVDILNRIQEK